MILASSVRKSSKSTASVTSKSSSKKGDFLTATQAKDGFLPACRKVIDTNVPTYVRDKSRVAFMTLTTQKVKGVFVTESAQFFKDNFARCSSLVRFGFVFQLTIRGSNQVVYARRHTSYKDPVDFLISKWQENIVEAAMKDADESALQQLARDFAKFTTKQNSRSEEDREIALERYKNLVTGIARMAIGHFPFEKKELPKYRDLDQ